MKLERNDIEKTEEIGCNNKGEKIFHVLTKGGLSIIGKQMPSGTINILTHASHPAIAMHYAQALDKSITYKEELYKSEMAQYKMPLIKFTPQLAYNLAKWHSQKAASINLHPVLIGDSLQNRMQYLSHSDSALRHYKASGMDSESALNEHKKNMNFPHQKETPAPAEDSAIIAAYIRKTGKDYPAGVEDILLSNKEGDNEQ